MATKDFPKVYFSRISSRKSFVKLSEPTTPTTLCPGEALKDNKRQVKGMGERSQSIQASHRDGQCRHEERLRRLYGGVVRRPHVIRGPEARALLSEN
jgi:hypothetical protein